MESAMRGFNEYNADGSLKLVPWVCWEEWDKVRVSLFSCSHLSVSSALNRMTAWRSRGCLPLVVEITASIIEIQQKDPYFRVNTSNKDAKESEEILAMLYCMTIMRLVNGVVEKTRKKTEISIGEAADTINIPRMLIDIRHECSHRDLPSLRLGRLASVKALDWLKSYYWEPQKKSIQYQSDGASRISKEINSRLCELVFFLEMKQDTNLTSPIKRKCNKKQVGKTIKNILRIYSSYSIEVVSAVLELLLKESGSSDFLYLDDDNYGKSIYWKSVITKLSNKQPEFFLALIRTVQERIETRESTICGSGERAIAEDTVQGNVIDRLTNLFAWLVMILKGLKFVLKKESPEVKESADTKLPKSTLVELLRKSLLVSCSGSSQLKDSSIVLANMVGNSYLVEKLNKLFLLSASIPDCCEENSSTIRSDIIFSQQDNSLKKAAEKLALLKHRKVKNKATHRAAETNDGKGWVVVKNWKKCPIGAASSGLLPFLDWDEDHNQVSASENKEQGSLIERNLKRKPDCGLEVLNETSGKKMKENGMKSRKDEEGVQGKLMIGGVWKKVEEQELYALAADVRVFI